MKKKRSAVVTPSRRSFCSDPEKEKEEDSKVSRKILLLTWSRRLIYWTAVLVLLALLAVQVSKCLRLYLDDPTYFSTKIVEQRQVPFPSVTVCPEKDGYKEDVLQEHGIPSISDYNDKSGNLTWTSSASIPERELFDLATYRVDDIFGQIMIRFFRTDADGAIYTFISTDSSDPSVEEQRHRKFGKCYTLHPEPSILKLGVYYVKLRLNIPVKIYLHGKDQFLDLSGRMGYKFYPNMVEEAQVSYEVIQLFTSADHEGHDCTDESFDQCMTSKLEDLMMESHGCVVPFLKSTEPVCTDPEAIQDTFWIAYNRVTNQLGDCQSPCETMVVSLSGRNSRQSSEEVSWGGVFLYFPQKVVRNREEHFYSVLSLVAEIGGYVGLLLGVSALHLFGFVDRMLAREAEKIRGRRRKS